MVGLPGLADEVRGVELDADTRRVEVTYHRGGRLIGALTARRTGRLAVHRRELTASLTATRPPGW
ncbi:hypothetical protein P8605_48515 [Streptomyces sp. T-3]|nr:hypothetical protein [Streptomyces sp. T-3]